MTNDDEERLVAEIPEELKRLIDADSRSNKEVVIAALWREYGGDKMGALDRRIEEVKQRVSMVERERNERDRELEELKEDLQALQSKRDVVESERESHDEKLQDAIEKCKGIRRNPDNPAIKTQASRVGMTPSEFIDELPERDDGGPRSL